MHISNKWKIKIGSFEPFLCNLNSIYVVALAYWNDEGELTAMVVKSDARPSVIGKCLDDTNAHIVRRCENVTKEELDSWIQYVKFMSI
jgi:hypothetical protein